MDKVEVGLLKQFIQGKPKGRLPGRIKPLEIPVEAGDTEKSEREGEELIQFPLCAFALDELTDLVTGGRHHFEQLLVGMANLAAKEFEDAQYLTGEDNRKTKGASQTFFYGHGRPGKVRILGHIGNPGRLLGGPDPPGQAYARPESNPTAQRLEF